ncbi:ricin-type beta-trefoil lectin domain protein [Herbidospora cretacea]|uniref:ricin-type beta-trefoil lectin domain protein n=1 Tax=Herbidospora cretacea TaxID=28444 RepID=UPI000774D7DD|nr:ricin-type beta-trefoil lectin domain protein [Herbidospora cretacea]
MRTVRHAATLALVLLASLLSLAPPAHAAATGPIRGIAAKCLDNAAGNTANGNPIVLWTCNGTAHQQWTLPGDGTVRVQGNHCLAVKNAGTVSTTPVWLYTCDGGPAQIWSPRPNGTLVNPNSGLCLSSKNVGTADGNPIWVYTCDAGPAQIWTPPLATPAPSGQAMPVGDLPGWRQVFTDDFTQTVPLGAFPSAVASRWTAYSGFADTSGHGRYAPDRVVSVHNGALNMFLHTENGQHLVSAPLPIIPGHANAYDGLLHGRYAVRFRADPVPGYKTAWLLWPDPPGVWSDGEIDFPEGSLDGHIEAFMHHRGNPQVASPYPTGVTFGGWHTAVVEWTPQSVRFLLDGTTIGTFTNTALMPVKPMHWVLQTETAIPNGPTDTAAGNVQIDWVSIWERV